MGKLLEGLQSDFDTAKEEKDQLTEQVTILATYLNISNRFFTEQRTAVND